VESFTARRSIVKSMATMLAFVILSLVALAYIHSRLIAWAMIVAVGLIVLSILKNLLYKKTLLSVGPQGVFSQSYSSDIIPWTAIISARVLKVRGPGIVGVSFIELTLLDPGRFRATPTLLLRKPYNGANSTGRMLISALEMDCSFGSLANALARYCSVEGWRLQTRPNAYAA